MTTTKRAFFLSAAATLLTDIVTKFVALDVLGDRTIDLGVIALRIVRNPGVAFGVGGESAPSLLIALISVLVIVLTVAVLRGAFPAGIASGLLLGGGLGNLLDRLTDGTVVDMLDLGWWPAFNLADVAIVLGVIGTLIASRSWTSERTVE